MKLKLLGICGSPRKGNSEFLIGKSFEDISKLPFDIDINIYSLRGKKIQPCLSCFKCMGNKGQCVLKDDFKELRQMWISADIIIYSCPVYHLSIPGQLKCFIDRLGNTFYGGYSGVSSVRHMKTIGILTQGLDFFSGQELTISYLILHAVLLNCIPVSGDGWHSYIGAAGWTYNQIDKDAMSQLLNKGNFDAEITISAAKSVVKRAIEVAAMIKSGFNKLQDKFSDDPSYVPYLTRLREEIEDK